MLAIVPECSPQAEMKRSRRTAGIQVWNAVNAAPRCVYPILPRAGRRAALPISPRTIAPSGVIAMAVYDTLAKGSNVLNPLTSEFFPSEKMRATRALFADSALSISDLTMLTAVPGGMKQD